MTTTNQLRTIADGLLEWLEDNGLDVYNVTIHVAENSSHVTMHTREANTRLVIADSLSALAGAPLEENRSRDYTSHRGTLTDAFGTVGRMDIGVIGPPSPAPCSTCRGRGNLAARTGKGNATVDVVCPVCNGSGVS